MGIRDLYRYRLCLYNLRWLQCHLVTQSCRLTPVYKLDHWSRHWHTASWRYWLSLNTFERLLCVRNHANFKKLTEKSNWEFKWWDKHLASRCLYPLRMTEFKTHLWLLAVCILHLSRRCLRCLGPGQPVRRPGMRCKLCLWPGPDLAMGNSSSAFFG